MLPIGVAELLEHLEGRWLERRAGVVGRVLYEVCEQVGVWLGRVFRLELDHGAVLNIVFDGSHAASRSNACSASFQSPNLSGGSRSVTRRWRLVNASTALWAASTPALPLSA